MSTNDPRDCITVSLDDYTYDYDSSDSITLSSLGDANLSIGGSSNVYPWTTTAVPWVTSNGINAGDWSNKTAAKISVDGKLHLNGEAADIEINGQSLLGILKAIQERMNILTVNTKLESEWEELKALGEQYRALEKHILEKQATWDKLKAMPPPEID